MDAADVPRDPGVDAVTVRRADVCHDRALRTHRAHRPPIREFPGNHSGRDVTGREIPGDVVDDVIAGGVPPGLDVVWWRDGPPSTCFYRPVSTYCDDTTEKPPDVMSMTSYAGGTSCRVGRDESHSSQPHINSRRTITRLLGIASLFIDI